MLTTTRLWTQHTNKRVASTNQCVSKKKKHKATNLSASVFSHLISKSKRPPVNGHWLFGLEVLVNLNSLLWIYMLPLHHIPEKENLLTIDLHNNGCFLLMVCLKCSNFSEMIREVQWTVAAQSLTSWNLIIVKSAFVLDYIFFLQFLWCKLLYSGFVNCSIYYLVKQHHYQD